MHTSVITLRIGKSGRLYKGKNLGFVELITAAGIGSILTTGVASHLSNKRERGNRIFTEKRNAYVGFIRSLTFRHQALAADRPVDQDFHYWLSLCDLVGSATVRESIKLYRELYDEVEVGHPPNQWEVQEAINAISKDIREDFDQILRK